MHYTKNFPGGVASIPPLFHLLQQLQTLNYLLLEVINGLRLDSDSHVVAFITHLNFLLENEIDPFKSIFKGTFHKKVLSVLKDFL